MNDSVFRALYKSPHTSSQKEFFIRAESQREALNALYEERSISDKGKVSITKRKNANIIIANDE